MLHFFRSKLTSFSLVHSDPFALSSCMPWITFYWPAMAPTYTAISFNVWIVNSVLITPWTSNASILYHCIHPLPLHPSPTIASILYHCTHPLPLHLFSTIAPIPYRSPIPCRSPILYHSILYFPSLKNVHCGIWVGKKHNSLTKLSSLARGEKGSLFLLRSFHCCTC